MDLESLQGTLRPLVQPLLEEECAGLVELKINRSPRGIQLIFFVDNNAGGITLDACARLNRRIGDLLESRNEISESYVVEVSSPGLDRNLKTQADFMRCLNKQVKFFLSEKIGEKLEWDAFIRTAGAESVEVDVKGTLLVIPYVKINKARLIL